MDEITNVAEFDGTPEVSGDMVIRYGKLFEVGDYPDKAFTFDRADLDRAVAEFQPCPIDLQHTNTVLDGKLGSVARLYPGEDGTSLMGEVHLPKWLDALLDNDSRKVSAAWDRATKRLQKLSLVLQPRVSDAALMAAFSASDDQPPQPIRRARMKFTDWITGKATEEGIDLEDVPATFADTTEDVSLLKAEVARLRQVDEQRQAQFAAEQAARRQAEAVTFATGLVDAQKITPAAAETLAPLVARLSAEDSTATFADGEQPTMALFQAFVDALPSLAHFTTEKVDTAAFALPSIQKTEGVGGPVEPDEARINALLAQSPAGQAVLNSKSNGASH